VARAAFSKPGTTFTIVSTREEAEELEVELKKMVDGNPREVRRLVRKFPDLVEELGFD